MPASQAASISSKAWSSLSPCPKKAGAEPTPPKFPQPSAMRATLSPGPAIAPPRLRATPAPSPHPAHHGFNGCDTLMDLWTRRLLTRCLDLCWLGDALCGGVAVEVVKGGELVRAGLDGVPGLAQEQAD